MSTNHDPRPPDGPIEENEAMGSLAPPPVSPGHEDVTRKHITYALLFLLGLLSVLAPALVASGLMTVNDWSEVFDKIYTPIVALTGTAVGFYFGQGRRRND